MTPSMSSFQPKRRTPMTNAERQQRWRDSHPRPSKRRHLQWNADGTVTVIGQVTGPTPPPGPPPRASSPTLPAPAIATPPVPEQNYCPHCGSCLRKRAKTPKLAA